MQVFKFFPRRGAHAAQQEFTPLQRDGMHVVQVFPGASVWVAQLEGHAGAVVPKLFPQGRVVVFKNVVFSKLHQLQLARLPVVPQRQGLVNRRRLFVGPGGRRCQVVQLEAQLGAAVSEAGLVNGVVAVTQRVVDSDGVFQGLGAGANDEVAFKGLGLAVGVMLHAKVLEADCERQGLHQITLLQVDKSGARGAPFGDENIGAERGIVHGQLALLRDFADGDRPGFRFQFAPQVPQFQRRVAVHEAPQADDDHGEVGEQVAQPVAGPFHGRHGDLASLPFAPGSESKPAEAGGDGVRRLVRGQGGLATAVVGQADQPPFLHVFLILPHGGEDARRVAAQAHACRDDEKRQDEQEPGAGIDIIQAHPLKHAMPEGAEFDYVVLVRLVLLQHRADDGRQGQGHQEGDGQVHGTDEPEKPPDSEPGRGSRGHRLRPPVLAGGRTGQCKPCK